MSITLLKDFEYEKAFETMSQLRTHLDKATFLSRLKEEVTQGYILVGIKEDEKYVALAGYRYSLNMAWGKFLYCDDLVVHEDYRKKGYGDQLMNYMFNESVKHGCDCFRLDSAVQRHTAHRLYLKHYMDIVAHHFSRNCK